MHDMLAPSAARPRRPRLFARTVVRWLAPAIVGEGAARVGAAVKVCWALAVAKLATLVGSQAWLSTAFRNYVAALIDHQRLECIKSERRARAKTAGNPQGDRAAGWNVFAPENAGFYPIETSQETKFRWSETAAIMPAWMPEGQHRIRIECLPVTFLDAWSRPAILFQRTAAFCSRCFDRAGHHRYQARSGPVRPFHAGLDVPPLSGHGRPAMAGSADQTHRVEPRSEIVRFKMAARADS